MSVKRNASAALPAPATTIDASPARTTDASGRTTTTPAVDYPSVNGVTLRPGTLATVVYTREDDDPAYATDPVTTARMSVVGLLRRAGLVSFAHPLPTGTGDVAIFDLDLGDQEELSASVFPDSKDGRAAALVSAKKLGQDVALSSARDAYHRAGLVAFALTRDDDRAVAAWDRAAPKEKTVMISSLGGNPFVTLKGTSGNADASRAAFASLRKNAHATRPTEVRAAHSAAIAQRKSLIEQFGETIKKTNAQIAEEKRNAARLARDEKLVARLAGNVDLATRTLATSLGLSPDEVSALLSVAAKKKNRPRGGGDGR